jgi:hypothetical protein
LLGLVALGGLTEAHLRRVGLSMLATAAGLVALSLPLGLGLWADFAASARGYGLLVAEAYPAFKLLTVHAALRSFGWPAGPGALLLGGLALAAAATVWWRDRRSPEPGDRVAAAVLLTICANAYTNFYDGLLLLVPAAAWWFDRSDGPRSRVIGACLAGSWLWLHGAVFVWRESTTLAPVGLLVLIWLLALAWLPEERKPMG